MAEQQGAIPLTDILNGVRRLPAGVALQLGIGLCRALEQADGEGRGRGVPGRRVRLSPGWFELAEDGRLALRDRESLPLSRRNSVWAAPEQIRSEPEDARAWIFSVGALVYEALQGVSLFHGESSEEAEELVSYKLDPHLLVMGVRSRVRETVPGLETPLRKALDAYPDKRPPTLRAFAASLEDLLREQPEGPDLADFVRWNRIPAAKKEDDSLQGFLDGDSDPMPPPEPLARVSLAPDDDEAPPITDPFATGGMVDAFGGFHEPLDEPSAEAEGSSATDFWATVGAPGALDEEDAAGPGSDTLSGPDPFAAATSADADTTRGDGHDAPPLPEVDASQADTLSLRREAPVSKAPTPPQSLLAFSEDDAVPLGLRRESPQSAKGEAGPLMTARVRPIREIPPSVLRAIRHGFRALVAAFVVLLLLVAIAWLGLLPKLPEAVATAIESGATSLAADRTVPGPVLAAASSVWAGRSDKARARAAWGWTVDHLPADIRRLVRPPPPPSAAVDWPGVPHGDGIVGVVTGRLVADAAVPQELGRMELSLSYSGNGMPLVGSVAFRAVPAEDPRGEVAVAAQVPPRVPIESPGSGAFDLPAGFWDVELNYRESEIAGGWAGVLRGVRSSPGHASRYSASVDVPAGRMAVEVRSELDDVTQHVRAWAYAVADGAAVREAEDAIEAEARASRKPDFRPAAQPPEGAPKALWNGPVSALPPLPAGPVHLRLVLDDGQHFPTVAWARDGVVPSGMQQVALQVRIDTGDMIDPKGPGVRLRATNFGADVSARTEVFLYAPGDNVSHAEARFRGEGARYFDAQPGTYDARLVFAPEGAPIGIFGEKVVAGFVVKPQGITQPTVEFEFPYTTLDLRVVEGGVDVSAEASVRVVRAGADRTAAKPVVDEEGIGLHAVPAGRYDIYVTLRGAPGRAAVDAAFPGVELDGGARWVQRWDTAIRPWTAVAPR